MIQNIFDKVGNTPIIEIKKLSLSSGKKIFAKLENLNPSGTIKDRLAIWVIDFAVKNKLVNKGVFVDVSIGNFGVSLSWFCRILNYRAEIFLPKEIDLSIAERIKLFGGEPIFTDAENMQVLVNMAQEYSRKNHFFYCEQFFSSQNIYMNSKVLAKETLKQIENVDAFVMYAGSGGTIAGIKEGFRELETKFYITKLKKVKDKSYRPLLNPSILSGIIEVEEEEVRKTQRELIQIEGIRSGFIGAMNVCAACKLSYRIPHDSICLTIISDSV